jgi:peptide/nickel transport system permease protein
LIPYQGIAVYITEHSGQHIKREIILAVYDSSEPRENLDFLRDREAWLEGWQAIRGITLLIVRRLAVGALILLGIVYLTHAGLNMARGQAIGTALQRGIEGTLETILRLLTGDLGLSYAASSTLNPLPVEEVVPDMLARSLGLLGITLLFSTFIGVMLGLIGARLRRSGLSMFVLIASIAGVSVPSFFAAFILQRLVIKSTQTLGTRILPVGGFGWDEHLILPLLVLSARPVAQITRVTMNSIKGVVDKEYVRTARSKGLSPPWITYRHVLRNAAIPIATTIGLSMRFSLSSLPVVEAFFGWSGLGFYLLRGISQQDDNLTVILILCLGALFILMNLALDIIYRYLDPRLRNDADRVGRSEEINLFDLVRSSLIGVWESLKASRLVRWIFSSSGESIARGSLRGFIEGDQEQDEQGSLYRSRRSRSVLRGIFSNSLLILGGIMVLGLVVISVWGPGLAPHNPYATQGLRIEDGEFLIPPFEPNAEYPWGTDVLGRDMMSLVFAGAWQTIRLASAVVLARLIFGFILGAISGWFEGHWLDRLLLGFSEMIAAFPTLLLGMLLILALGIREGFTPFVIALCFVGWGEPMQYVRGEVIAMRPKTFIESAVSVGRRLPGIISKHILPNLVPALISLAALEMGAVLMLLGELGFIGIFIGGGAFAELDIDMPPYHYSDVPEWGALLSNVRLYAQAFPWTALYPALAFFLAILAFNLFGEGIRKLVTVSGVRLGQIFNRYTFLIAAISLVGMNWFRGSTGMLSIYREQASAVDGESALRYVEALTADCLEGRAMGTVGLDVSAEWIAMQFEELGLQPAGKDGTFFQPRERDFEVLTDIPVLAVDDNNSQLEYREDYTEFPAPVRNLGSAVGEVRVVATGDLSQVGWTGDIPALEDLDLSDEIVMVLAPEQVNHIRRIPQAGMLVVAADPQDVQRRYTLSAQDPHYRIYGLGRDEGQDLPTLMITESIANRILAGTGETVTSLRTRMDELQRDEVIEFPTDRDIAMEIQGEIRERVTVNNVLAYWPGQAATGQTKLDDRMVVLMAKYDTPTLPPEGDVPHGAVDNASGIAVMLEVIRAMKQTDYEPNRTILFVAYSGEGEEAGGPVMVPEVAKLLQAKAGFSGNFEVDAIINIRGLSSDQGDALELLTAGSLRLGNLLEDSARRFSVATVRGGEGLDPSVIYQTGSSYDSGEEASRIVVTWQGWEAYSNMNNDEIRFVSEEQLEQSGRTIAMAVMVAGRELRY